ncbi:Ribosomal large subunit pseudouridine synthase A, putative, partial [Perkinsus marinus ATCC 50983]
WMGWKMTQTYPIVWCDEQQQEEEEVELDIFTSGIIMVAHTYAAYYQLRHQFKKRAILKKYICLVHGHMDEDSGIIDTNIQTYSSSSNSRSKHIPISSSSSSYSTIINNNKKVSLLEVEIPTGRTHQIRLHMYHIGHPIVSDY